jgi:hypothetical protein
MFSQPVHPGCSYHHRETGETVTWRFEESGTRGVSLVLEPNWPLLNEALADSVSCMAGIGGTGLCTCWNDRLIYRLEDWSDPRR